MSHRQPDEARPARPVRFSTALLLLLGAIAFAGGGCAARSSPQLALGEYRKMLERQKAGMPLEEDALKQLPEMTAADHERLGDTYLRQGNMNMAFLQYDKTLRLDPALARVRYKVGLLLLQKGSAEEAIKAFQEVLNTDDDFALAYEGMGQALLKMGKVPEAEQHFRRALHSNHELWQSHNFLGIMYTRQKRFEGAIAEYHAAIALNPEQGMLFNNLGMAYFYKGEYEQAVQAFSEAMATGLTDNRVYNNLGLALAKMGRHQEAFKAFKGSGDEARAYNNLGVIYLEEKKYHEAVSSFEKAIALNPSYYHKANENMKIAQKALVEVTQVSEAQSSAFTPPPFPSSVAEAVNSDPAPEPQELRPSAAGHKVSQPSLYRASSRRNR